MRTSNDQLLKDVIEEFIKTFKLNDPLNEIKLKEQWSKLTGKVIANHTKRISVKNKILYIELDSPALKNELSYAKEKIIEKINAKFPEPIVEKIVFI